MCGADVSGSCLGGIIKLQYSDRIHVNSWIQKQVRTSGFYVRNSAGIPTKGEKKVELCTRERRQPRLFEKTNIFFRSNEENFPATERKT